jgi:hypothetical protein
MGYYRNKTPIDLKWQENRKRLQLEAQVIMDRVMNTALAQMDEEFTANLERGELISIESGRDDLMRYLKRGILLEAAAVEGTVEHVKGEIL